MNAAVGARWLPVGSRHVVCDYCRFKCGRHDEAGEPWIYATCGVPAEPFANVRYYAPYKSDPQRWSAVMQGIKAA